MTTGNKRPDWFLLIAAWAASGMGNRGPTLPFIAGALIRAKRQRIESTADVERLLREMSERPVLDHGIYVFWCPTAEAPVLELREVPSEESWQRWNTGKNTPRPRLRPLEFGADITSRHGLGCTNLEDCIQKLAADGFTHIAKGNFSRHKAASGLCEYRSFTDGDVKFIDRVFPPNRQRLV